MLIPQVVGFKLDGAAARGRDRDRPGPDRHRRCCARRASSASSSSSTAPASRALPLADRATIANMAPEYGATCGIFPIDDETLALPALHRPAGARWSRWSRRTRKEQGLFHDADARRRPVYTDTLELDLGDVEPSLAGPKRPQDRVPLHEAEGGLRARARRMLDRRAAAAEVPPDGESWRASPARAVAPRSASGAGARTAGRASRSRRDALLLDHGSVVIAAITSCTNTSNPSVMLGAGLLAKKAVERGLDRQAVGEDEPRARARRSSPTTSTSAGLTPYLEQLGFNLVGYGCTTCIGNSGPLPEAISEAIDDGRPGRSRRCCRGNRNFEGRINSEVRANYLASPPLVVAYALAGTMDIDLVQRAARRRTRTASRSTCATSGRPSRRSRRRSREAVQAEMFQQQYADVFEGDERWNGLDVPDGRPLRLGRDSTYVKKPAVLRRHGRRARRRSSRSPSARVLAVLGDSVTTDHISPAGVDQGGQPGRAVPDRARRRAEGLQLLRLAPRQPRGDGARHVRQRPAAQPARARAPRAASTRHLPDGELMSIFDAADALPATRACR